MQPSHGNGSSKFNIYQDEHDGWVRVHTDRRSAFPEDFARILSEVLTDWFRKRPELVMRCIVPVARDGNTVELHAWFRRKKSS